MVVGLLFHISRILINCPEKVSSRIFAWAIARADAGEKAQTRAQTKARIGPRAIRLAECPLHDKTASLSCARQFYRIEN
jgi:hypothetical protein